MDVALIAAVAAAVFTGAALQRLSGIGFSLVSAPVLALISGARSGVALTNLLAVVVALIVFAGSARRVDRAKAPLLIAASLAGVLPGTIMFRLLPSAQLQVAVGAITALGLAIASLAPRLRGEARPLTACCAGLASGFSAAAAGAGGPALTVYAVATGWPQAEFAATAQLVYATQNVAALAGKGVPRVPAAWLGVAVAAVLCGLLAGHLGASRIDAARARRAAVAIAALAALATVLKGALS